MAPHSPDCPTESTEPIPPIPTASTADDPRSGAQEPPTVMVTTPPRSLPAWLMGPRGLLVGLGLGVLLTFVGGQLLGRDPTNGPAPAIAAAQADPSDPEPASGNRPAVTVATVQTAQVPDLLTATGTVEARELVPVRSTATGLQVMRLLVDEGQPVQANQPMALLDNSILRTQLIQARADLMEAEAALAAALAGSRPQEIAQAREAVTQAAAAADRAQAGLVLAQQRVERNRLLFEEGAIAEDRLMEVMAAARQFQADLDSARARLREAQQQLQLLQAGTRAEEITQAEARKLRAQGRERELMERLRDTQVVASASGIVAQRNLQVGDTIGQEGPPPFTIVEAGVLELHLKVPATAVQMVRPGQPVQVTADGQTDFRLMGQVREVEPTVDAQSRQATVKVALQSPRGLKPGMFLRGAIATGLQEGLAIPSGAVLPQADGTAVVYRLNGENQAEAVTVETGSLLPGDLVAVRGSLDAGQGVIVKGAAYLKDGDRVRVVPDAGQ
jgi:HlyD family secretion protein